MCRLISLSVKTLTEVQEAEGPVTRKVMDHDGDTMELVIVGLIFVLLCSSRTEEEPQWLLNKTKMESSERNKYKDFL